MAKDDDTIDKTETPVVKRRGTALATPLLGIVLGIVGTVLLFVELGNVVSAALSGNGNPLPYFLLFALGALLALIAVIIGIVGIFRGGHRFLSFLSLLIGLVPAAIAVAIYVANRV
jgi:hypothetical protein